MIVSGASSRTALSREPASNGRRAPSGRTRIGSLLGEQEGADEPQSPVRAAAVGGGVDAHAAAELHPLLAELVEVGEREVYRDRPLVGLPVVRGFGVDADGRRRTAGPAQERLDEGLIDLRAPSARLAGGTTSAPATASATSPTPSSTGCGPTTRRRGATSPPAATRPRRPSSPHNRDGGRRRVPPLSRGGREPTPPQPRRRGSARSPRRPR